MTLPDLPAGIYRHYKGHHYLVLGYAQDSNAEGRMVVVYAGLELEGAISGHPRLNVRAVEDFFANVDGKPRFTYIGATWDKH